MAMTTTVLSVLLRALGVVQVVLGLVFWSGNAYNLVPLHMSLGMLLVLCLWGLAIIAIFARVSWTLVVLAIAWGIFVPVFGMTQVGILPGSFHWIIQLLHLLVGFAAIGLGENLAKRIRSNRSARIPA